MRGVLVSELGGPEVLTVADCPEPVPGTGQVLVEVSAAGVNFSDIYAREGRPPYGREPPFVLGSEGAGTILALGAGVSGLAAGDRVAWASAPGSYAERAVIPAAAAVVIPDRVDTQVAAAAMMQGITAHYLCHSTCPVAPGEVAVVHAAAGGVGLLLTQLVKLRGGTVIATTSGPAKADLARQAGADHVTGYEDFGATVAGVTGGAGAHVVYDGVGRATFAAGLAALRPRGMMVLYGGASGAVPPVEPQDLAEGGSLFLTRPTMRHYIASREELLWRTGDLFGWIADGRLSIRIGGTYPLTDAARAHHDLAARRTTGKLLLLPG
jgi:NADPH2:quinone reductase